MARTLSQNQTDLSTYRDEQQKKDQEFRSTIDALKKEY
jgi:hypothetical protein